MCSAGGCGDASASFARKSPSSMGHAMFIWKGGGQGESLMLLHGIGHLPMIERPRQSVMDYLEFRSGLSSDGLS